MELRRDEPDHVGDCAILGTAFLWHRKAWNEEEIRERCEQLLRQRGILLPLLLRLLHLLLVVNHKLPVSFLDQLLHLDPVPPPKHGFLQPINIPADRRTLDDERDCAREDAYAIEGFAREVGFGSWLGVGEGREGEEGEEVRGEDGDEGD